MEAPDFSEDRYHILAPLPRVEEHAQVLKHGDTFAVFNRMGDIRSLGLGEEGLYHRGTRHLSRFELAIDGRPPLLLRSTVREDNALLVVDLTNPDLLEDGSIGLPRDTVHVLRSAVLWRGSCHVRFSLRNYGERRITLPVSIGFDADFRDIFEIRGQKRARRGSRPAPLLAGDSAALPYHGLDGVERRTVLRFKPAPAAISATAARFDIVLDPGAESSLSVVIDCNGAPAEARLSFPQAVTAAEAALAQAAGRDARILTTNDPFNAWVNRSLADVRLMVTETAHGPYPYAGIPWFSTPFGRDGIITALECLWLNPDLAKGVLRYLGAMQATAFDPDKDAEPGKILHETRAGEMAALGEIPFARYYGTVDATPLFVMLAGAYYQRTADRELIAALWPNIEAALAWMDTHGDADGDGFVEYKRHSKTGLVTQGWKDSFDSVFHADSSLAEGPIALCEVQGYVYGARRAAAGLAAMLGDAPRADALDAQAEALRRRFEETFWSEDLRTYVLALDGEKRPCRVRTSNAGHCLLTGIAGRERALEVAATLLDDSSWSGWGVRTVAGTEARYNPMSYHNGSVWPHDNALIAAGFARYGLSEAMLRVFGGLFDASRFVELQRMPELFCGFGRRPGEGPTLYPVACAPQSWAAASVFMLLASCLGLRIDAPARRIGLFRPVLPAWLERLRIAGLRVGAASVDLELTRHAEDVGVTLTRREGEIEVVVVK